MMKIPLPTHAWHGLLLSSMLCSSHAMALSTSTDYPDTGKLAHSHPVNTSTFSTPLSGGGRFISQQATILNKSTTPTSNSAPVFTLANKEWTYTRGVGKVPSECKVGYEPVGLLCKKVGASFFSKQIPKQCADGMVNSHGLCYTPCAAEFKGFGPFCSGNLTSLKPEDLTGELAKQHADALKTFNQPGIALKEGQVPRIKTDLAFGPTVCKLAPAFQVGNLLLGEASSTIIGKVGEALTADLDLDIKNSSGDTIWSVPSLNEFVAYDLSATPTCTDKSDKFVSQLNIDNSVTVKASTQMFDPLFDNLGGVNAGIATVSIYELIPFRVYGSSGVTLGTNFNVESTILKNTAPFLINGVPHAHQTKLDVTPGINFWVGLDAFVRITSVVSALPDVLQVGGDIDLDIMKWQLPYSLTEGVRDDAGSRKLFLDETLDSTFSAGNGQAKPFLKVLGQDIKVFKDSDTKTWEGHQESKNLLTRQGSY